MIKSLFSQMNKYSKIALTLLIVFSINISYAAPQDDLETKGIAELYSNANITLKAGETYYIALQGGTGGSGGSGWKWDFIPGGTGAIGVLNYYQLEVTENNVNMNLYIGRNGSGGGTLSQSTTPATPGSGGGGGTNDLSIGNGTNGGRGTIPGGSQNSGSGGGGGGGAASIITFNGSNNQRVVANGGNGGRGGVHSSDASLYPGGSNGTGGTSIDEITNTPNVKITKLSVAEGTARVTKPTSSGLIIRKQRKVTGDAIKVSNLTIGEHIVLTNSINNTSSIFRKEASGQFLFVSGNYQVPNTASAVRNAEWYDFSKYAVSGSGTNTTLRLVVKSDLSFVGGDGSAIFPFYPEGSGNISGASGSGGSGSSIDSFENTETLANSIISVSSQIENTFNYQKIKDEQALLEGGNNKVYVPFSIRVKSANNLTATHNSSFLVSVNVNGRKSNMVECNVMVNGVSNDNWITLPSNNLITVSGLSNGFNTIYITVKDQEGDTQIDILSVWIL